MQGSALYDLARETLRRARPYMISLGRPCVISVLCMIGEIKFPAESSFTLEVVWARRHDHPVQCGTLSEEKMHLRSTVW